MLTFPLEIITPERIVYTDEVSLVSVPSEMGRLGILPRHAPLFAQLVEGEVKIQKGKDDIYLSIGGGYLEVTKEKTMILVTRAVHADELNEQEILKAKKEAEVALEQKPMSEDLVSVQAALRQTIVDLQILRKRKKKASLSRPSDLRSS